MARRVYLEFTPNGSDIFIINEDEALVLEYAIASDKALVKIMDIYGSPHFIFFKHMKYITHIDQKEWEKKE